MAEATISVDEGLNERRVTAHATAVLSAARTRGGAEGVGRAATSSVVLSSLFVILADIVLVKFILVFFS